MNRNILYLIIGVLAAATGVFAYQFYQERQKASGVDIHFGKTGVSIENK